MSIADVQNTSDKCKGAMDRWGIVALQDGKYDGPGYGSKFTRGNHLGCGYVGTVLVMTGTQTKSLNFNQCP